MTNSPRGILWAEWINPPTPFFVNGSPRKVFPNIPGTHRHWVWVYPDRKTMLLTPRSFDLGEPHHVTLQYDVEKSAVEHLIGKRFLATLTELRQDDHAQAFRVVLPADIAPLWKGDTIPPSNRQLQGIPCPRRQGSNGRGSDWLRPDRRRVRHQLPRI